MNELDFIDALGDKGTKRASAAREFLGKLKEAGFGPEIAAGLAGAGLLSGIGYAAMKPGKGGSSSKEQRSAIALIASNEAAKDQAERDNRPLTFREDVTDAIAPSSKRLADVMARHPVKAALLLAPQGALAGFGALRLLKALK